MGEGCMLAAGAGCASISGMEGGHVTAEDKRTCCWLAGMVDTVDTAVPGWLSCDGSTLEGTPWRGSAHLHSHQAR